VTNSHTTALQYFYKVLQALALEEELPEQAEDKTIPRYKQIYKVGHFQFNTVCTICLYDF
jgi:hypothetical protein